MSLLENFRQDQARVARRLLGPLIQESQLVGDVFALGYESASVQIHDRYRKDVGGIPSLCFLIATRIHPDDKEIDYQNEESSVILLRVMDAVALPTEAEALRVRVEVAQKVAGKVGVNWDSAAHMDPATNHLLSYAGVRCRVIGTFFVDQSEMLQRYVLRFGSDISNYYPNKGLKVFKPNERALSTIVNYVDEERVHIGRSRVEIGEVRYASTNRSFQGISNVTVLLSPEDLLGQKTALFGMTRSGKSNTTKIIIQSVFRLRYPARESQEEQTARRIGQLVFDPNGEYANENVQDADAKRNAAAIKNVWQSAPEGTPGAPDDVITYGLTTHPNDPKRRLMLLNFYADANLQVGKSMIDASLADDSTKFIENFRQVIFEEPDLSDRSAKTRYDRQVLIYRALLYKAGFAAPNNLRPNIRGVFNAKLLESMANSKAKDPIGHQSAAKTLNNPDLSWGQLALACQELYDFMQDRDSGYKDFDTWYVTTGASGNQWADEPFNKLITMFKYPNGVRQIGKLTVQHTSQDTQDYADAIYDSLVSGCLVIVDQSSGDPEINQSSAERVMRRIFRGQQERFRKGDMNLPEIVVYVEEAHNLLPAGQDMDLQDIWVRTAKEGAKYHIGLVYATQEVSSIQRNILKNTANWFIGHLNNTDETKELCKYYDFEDFEASIRRAQDRGFLRMKTLSNLFVVPVQVRKFEV